MKKRIIALSLASLIALSGCTTYDAYTGEQKTSSTAKGAGIGAGSALLLSYIANRNKSSSERNKRMLRDAGIGFFWGSPSRSSSRAVATNRPRLLSLPVARPLKRFPRLPRRRHWLRLTVR